MLADDAGDLRFVDAAGARRPQVVKLERLQESTHGGPCHDAYFEIGEVLIESTADPPARGSPPSQAWYRHTARKNGLGAVAAIPIVSRGRCWGVLDLYRERAGPWTQSDLIAARLLADLAASYLLLESERRAALPAQEELAQRNLLDSLTGLPGRALLFDRLHHALVASPRNGTYVAVFFVDLDKVKEINDRSGHRLGDEVLIEVARRLVTTVRAGDTVGRLAGDEFLLVCENVSNDAGTSFGSFSEIIVERIRHALRDEIVVGSTSVTVSASIGVALGTAQMSAEDVVAEADASMYEAKSGGHSRHRGAAGPVRLELSATERAPH